MSSRLAKHIAVVVVEIVEILVVVVVT